MYYRNLIPKYRLFYHCFYSSMHFFTLHKLVHGKGGLFVTHTFYNTSLNMEWWEFKNWFRYSNHRYPTPNELVNKTPAGAPFSGGADPKNPFLEGPKNSCGDLITNREEKLHQCTNIPEVTARKDICICKPALFVFQTLHKKILQLSQKLWKKHDFIHRVLAIWVTSY